VIVNALRSTSFRTFVLYPVVVVGWESLLNRGWPPSEPLYLLLLAWGYLQYRLIGKYRMRLGGGGPGMSRPPERLVTSGPYAWCRNPMYAGHMVFLVGLALTFRSLLACAIAVASAVWFHDRVRRDEARLRERFGPMYDAYSSRVTRWIPRWF
jgi:protein-S-isoprenylcysteine O-methyltransferase Ste14